MLYKPNRTIFGKIIAVPLTAAVVAVTAVAAASFDRTVSAAEQAGAADINSLDRTSHGYGQGVETDDNNRPVGDRKSVV